MSTRLFTTVIACALFIISGGNAFAQQRGGWGNGQQGERPDPAQIAKRQADQMKTDLKLSEDQYSKVLDIFKKQYEDMQKFMQNGERMDRESMTSYREKMNSSIKSILTEDQYKKWIENPRNRWGGQGGGPNGPRN